MKNQSGLKLSKANKMSLQQDTAPVWQGCGEMSVVPPAHRIPPAPVPCGFLWLSWAAGKGTEGQIGKGWGGHFGSHGTKHPISPPGFAGSLSVAWFSPHQPGVQVGGRAVCMQSTWIAGAEVL